ncbi:Disintegrin and metalloproteinase domain-containing protein 23 [Cichlidogyrus casuarinus]|uniref:Disintegrin and metalloproteinase domain-containing protein 23 n=1 Tax=Cichlidogyrus casuarinus TaxID=1844966 RepID=A0ABD2PM37_9PLAT
MVGEVEDTCSARLSVRMRVTSTKSSGNVVDKLGMFLNHVALFFQPLANFTMQLDHVELWNEGDRILIPNQIKTALNDIAEYVIVKRSASESGHVTLLLTAQRFSEGVDFLAVPNSVCTPRALGVIGSLDASFPDLHAARLAATLIREVIGLRAFDQKCTPNKIIAECDQEAFKKWASSDFASCLSGKPIETRCGNGRLDRGEECDLGSEIDTSTVPCCNPKTCLMDEDASCVSGACCHRCQLRPKDFVCRKPKDLFCDVPEFCSGNDVSSLARYLPFIANE